jgi:hypothetical protein
MARWAAWLAWLAGTWVAVHGLALTATGQVVRVPSVTGQAPPTAIPLDQAIARALAADPATAPYPIAVIPNGRRMVLQGRVATHAIHDQAIRTALAYTSAIDDELVIDTAEIARAVPAAAPAPVPAASAITYTYSPPYYYPPPLFGRIDEPFFGFEPPAISYPPWWPPLSARRLAEMAPLVAVRPPAAAAPAPPTADHAAPEPAQAQPPATLAGRQVEMVLDNRGIAVLRGKVASAAERDALVERVKQAPGVNEVVSELEIEGEGEAPATPARDAVPPPPEPGRPAPTEPEPAAPAPRERPEPRTAAPADPDLTRAVEESLAHEGPGTFRDVQVRAASGHVALTGRVAGVGQALRAIRAARATPGVRGVEDRLAFAVPSGRDANPLLTDFSPEDVSDYLLGQVRRQVGDAAAVQGVEARGDVLTVKLGPEDAAQAGRVEAVVRSMAILRGFRVRVEPSAR